ncbi:MAG: metallophosphoesterase [Proteobacteria bacterium]|nr:metallophosphoesterase [Pseudomonadota bacterium]
MAFAMNFGRSISCGAPFRLGAALFALMGVLALCQQAMAAAGSGPARLALGDDYTFVVLSDSRSGDRVYAKVVDQAARRAPRFVVHVGDVLPTMGDKKQWERFQSISEPLRVPFYIAPGNHDMEDARTKALWKGLVDLPGNETYYSFTAGDDLFVVLSSHEPNYRWRIDRRQLEWLKRTLDPQRYEHQFVFVHHPMFLWKGAFHENESLDRYPHERDDLHHVFVDKQVDIVFHGHEHGYRRMDKDGVRYMIAAGAGSPLYNRASFHHFVLLKVAGPLVEVKVIDKEGVLRDEFMIMKSSKVKGER